MRFRLIQSFWSYVGICWLFVTCVFGRCRRWLWVNGNKILAFRLCLLKWLLHWLMWNRFSEIVWPLFSVSFYLCLSCFVSPVSLLSPFVFFCLFPASFLSLRCTHESCCRHIVFITRSLPAGPRLAAIGWLMRMSQLNMQHFPFSSLSHQEIRSVTAKRIWARTYGQIIHVNTTTQAGAHMHSQTPGKRVKLLGMLHCFLSLFLSL